MESANFLKNGVNILMKSAKAISIKFATLILNSEATTGGVL